MKLYVFCAFILCLTPVFGLLLASVDDELHKYQTDCTKDTGSDIETVESARRNRKIPDNGKLDIFAGCMLKKFNVLNTDGTVNQNVNTYRIFSDNGFIHKISEKCKNQSGASVAEINRKIMNCFLNEGEIMLPLKQRE